MKILHALPGMSNSMNEVQVEKFLESRLNVQLATIDDTGEPVIQPLWFYYDKGAKKLYIETRKDSRKVRNILARPSVYFSIDDEDLPYKGVKGKGTVRVIQDVNANLKTAEKIDMKYLGTLDHPVAKMLLENVRNGSSVVLELSPRFFSAWDMSGA